MKLELLNQVFGGIAGVRKDGASFLFAEETDVSVYVGFPAEVLTLARIAKVTLSAELIAIETHKSDKFFFAPQDVVGVKTSQSEASKVARGGGAGFR